MLDVNIDDRAVRVLRYLPPEDLSIVRHALAELAEDPSSANLKARRIKGNEQVFVLRASDRLRVIYRVESNPDRPTGPVSRIVVEDITSREMLRQFLDEAV